MAIPTGRAFAKALEEAGVISDLNSITRVIIDIQPGDAARVYVERVGDKRLLDLFKGQLGLMLAEATAEPEPCVRYWVQVADDLLADSAAMKVFQEASLRVVEHGGRVDRYSRKILVEDAGAPAELDGKDVELTFTRDGIGPARVAKREVTG